jgi:hypothetical protein
MGFAHFALGIGSVVLGGLLIYGAVSQVLSGETWGATGKGRVRRDEEPAYFWYLFAARVLLGPPLVALGLWSL